MKKFKVLISDPLAEEGLKLLDENSDIIEYDVKTGLKEEELKEVIKNYHGIIVRSGTKVTRNIIESAENLMVICRAGVGLDNIDLKAATEKGIVVMNAPAGNTVSTAELTFGMILAMLRKIPQAHMSIKEGKWDRKSFKGVEAKGKTLGIIGLGRIGREVAMRAKAFKMNVIGYDPYVGPDQLGYLKIKIGTFEEVIKNSDIITVHTPLTDKTRKMIGKKEIEMMKDGVFLVNCARGGIIDEEAMIEGLNNGKVKGIAVDVYSKEPPEGLDWVRDPRIITTPHIGASTQEAQINVALEGVRGIIEFFRHGIAPNAVNFPPLGHEELKVLKPYINLAYKLGKIHSVLTGGKAGSIEIHYKGEISDYNTSVLTGSILRGFIETSLDRSVNLVNAKVIANERGIKISEIKSDYGDGYKNLIRIISKINGKENSVSGTVFGESESRIVGIDSYTVDITPEGSILIIRNRDIPKVVGTIGTFLGEQNINIANLNISRKERGGIALCVLNLDTPLSEEQIEKLRNLENILEAHQVILK